MKLVIHFKSALLALAIFLPVTHAQGMEYISKWFTKKTTEEAKKEAVKVVTEKVVEKTTPGQYVAQGALAVARVAGNTAVGTAEFTLNHPKLAIITGAGIYAYLNRDKIKKKLEEFKPYLKVAGAGVAVAGALIAGKKLNDLYNSDPDLFKLLLGSGSSSNAQELPKIDLPNMEAIWKQCEKELQKQKVQQAAPVEVADPHFEAIWNQVRPAAASAPAQELDYEALWNECQEIERAEKQQLAAAQEAERIRIQEEAERVRAQAAAQELRKQQEAIWQEAERARIENERQKELAAQEAAWQEAERARIAQQAAQEAKKQEEAQRAAQEEAAKREKEKQAAAESRKVAVRHIPGLEPRSAQQAPAIKPAAVHKPAAIYGTPHAMHDEPIEQFARRFNPGYEDELDPRIYPVYAPQPAPVRDADTPWVEEFHEMGEQAQANHPWVQEFEQQEDAEAAINALGEEGPVAVVSDGPTFEPAQDVRDMRNLQDRYESRNAIAERARVMNRVMPTNQNARARITFQNPPVPATQAPAQPRIARVPSFDVASIPAPTRPMQKMPAARL